MSWWTSTATDIRNVQFLGINDLTIDLNCIEIFINNEDIDCIITRRLIYVKAIANNTNLLPENVVS